MSTVAQEIEVVAKATRRRFTLEYKRKVVLEADACKTPGEVGALLRRDGLYSSHPATWRAARERGDLVGARKKRGPAAQVTDSRDKIIAEQAACSRGGSTVRSGPRPWSRSKKLAALLGTPPESERS